MPSAPPSPSLSYRDSYIANNYDYSLWNNHNNPRPHHFSHSPIQSPNLSRSASPKSPFDDSEKMFGMNGESSKGEGNSQGQQHLNPNSSLPYAITLPSPSTSKTTLYPPFASNAILPPYSPSPPNLPIYFLPDTPIDPTTLTPEQLKIYKGFCNKEIDKVGPEIGWIEKARRSRWGRDVNWGKVIKEQFEWKRLQIWLALAFAGLMAFLLSHYENQIVSGLTPIGQDLQDIPAGWTIPIGIIFVLSFPPLFGAEVVIILCGLIWGLWVGWGIVSAGTLLGELGNFYAFRILKSLSVKYERSSFQWASLAYIVRQRGFKIVLAVRYSALPSHFSTAIFSTCGTGFWSFTVAALLSMPQKLSYVYAGVIFKDSANGKESTKDELIFAAAFGATILVTLIVMWYVNKMMFKDAEAIKAELKRTRATALNEVAFGKEAVEMRERELGGIGGANVMRGRDRKNSLATTVNSATDHSYNQNYQSHPQNHQYPQKSQSTPPTYNVYSHPHSHHRSTSRPTNSPSSGNVLRERQPSRAWTGSEEGLVMEAANGAVEVRVNGIAVGGSVKGEKREEEEEEEVMREGWGHDRIIGGRDLTHQQQQQANHSRSYSNNSNSNSSVSTHSSPSRPHRSPNSSVPPSPNPQSSYSYPPVSPHHHHHKINNHQMQTRAPTKWNLTKEAVEAQGGATGAKRESKMSVMTTESEWGDEIGLAK